jgi:HAMP domain-containing protein
MPVLPLSSIAWEGWMTGRRRRVFVSLRLKLLAAFAGAFTIVFAFIAIWVFQFTTQTTEQGLIEELSQSARGGATNIDAAVFEELVTTVPSVGGPTLADGTGAGYPDSPLYLDVASSLLDTRRVVTDAGAYSYFRDPSDGRLYFAASAGYLLDPQRGVTYRVPVEGFVSQTTYAFMERGLSETVSEPPYTDEFGSFISAYSPILNDAGQSVGAIGLDYPLDYVDEVQTQTRARLLPVLIGSYAVLFLLVLLLATAITRPVKRLTRATALVAEGNYEVDVSQLITTRFPDELAALADSFSAMAEKVAARERSLTTEVQRLRVEIDQVLREEAVVQLTESDAFADIAGRAAEMRRRMREQPDT